MTTVTGVLLAGGAGSRMGRPKALKSDAGGSWLHRSCATLLHGGCAGLVVVIGAAADEVRELIDQQPADQPVDVVEATDWASGMGASLRAGFAALGDADAALVHLVDLPDVGPDVVARLVGLAAPGALARATYSGVPGHPVLIGRDHWPGVLETVSGDQGARAYLGAHHVVEVDCSDLASGRDVDRPGEVDGPMLGR